MPGPTSKASRALADVSTESAGFELPAKRQRRSAETSSEEPPRVLRVPPKLCFFGRGGTPGSCSLLPMALRGGRLSDGALAAARRAWAHLPEHGFRMTDRVPPRRTNGGIWKELAPPAARAWFEGLRSKSAVFWEALAAAATHDSNGGERPSWDGAVSDCVFAYGGLKRTTATEGFVSVAEAAESDSGFHVDGGPSLVFLCLTLEGERLLEIETAEGRQRIHLRSGDWYLTSPACFWHRVLAVPGGPESSTTLLLRSAVLTRGVSGGGHFKLRPEVRSHGMPYATRRGLEELAPQIARIIEGAPFFM